MFANRPVGVSLLSLQEDGADGVRIRGWVF